MTVDPSTEQLVGLEFCGGDDVDRAVQQRRELLVEPEDVRDRSARLEAYEQVEIRIGPIVTPSDGAEDPNSVNRVTREELPDVVPVPVQQVARGDRIDQVRLEGETGAFDQPSEHRNRGLPSS